MKLQSHCCSHQTAPQRGSPRQAEPKLTWVMEATGI